MQYLSVTSMHAKMKDEYLTNISFYALLHWYNLTCICLLFRIDNFVHINVLTLKLVLTGSL